MDEAVKVFLEYRDKILNSKAEKEKPKKETKSKKITKKTTKKNKK